jgi:hypothetical protein
MACDHIKAFISYVDDDDGGKEPALCITAKQHVHEPRLAVLALSKAWAYTSDTYLIQKSKEFAEHIGLGDSWMETRNVADVIMHGLDSLVMAPEYEMVQKERHYNQRSIGSVEIKSGNETVHEEELFA